ncbi:MAG: hypothetical protein ABUL63_03410 [Acidobacteriota bacterium]
MQRLRAVLPQGFERHIRSAREMDRERRETREADSGASLPTAVAALDRLLDGGLPRGQLVEMVGARTSGRFSTVLATLAGATGVGEAAALIDLGDALDPTLAQDLGVDLRRLLWLRPTSLKHALAATEMVLASGFPLVVLDLGPPPVRGGRGLEAAWLRIARAAEVQGTALLVSSPYRVSGTSAGIVLKADRARIAWDGTGASVRLLSGADSRLQIEKHRGRLPGQSEALTLAFDPIMPLAPPSPRAAPARLPSHRDSQSFLDEVGRGDAGRLAAVAGG